jgi:hypothetical protein
VGFVLALFVTLPAHAAAARTKPALPKIVLVGDSISGGYGPLVAKRLEGKAVIVRPPASGGDSSMVLQCT